MTNKNIGIKVDPPKKTCDDSNCPWHGNLKIRGKILTATVIATRMQKTATVEFARRAYIPKFERYEKRRTRIKAHNPECISAKEGDVVQIGECRPLAKSKNFVIFANLGQERGFVEKMEALEEGKTRKEKVEEEPADESSTSEGN